jgi:phosphatidylinositol-3-phosphatase
MDWYSSRSKARAGIAAAAVMLLGGLGGPAVAQAYPQVRHVFVIVLENKEFSEWYSVGRAVAPYLSETLPSEGALLPDYYGIGHDSADNYIALISGQPPTADTKNDCPDPLTNVPTTANGDGVAQGGGCVYPANFPTVAVRAGDPVAVLARVRLWQLRPQAQPVRVLHVAARQRRLR